MDISITVAKHPPAHFYGPPPAKKCNYLKCKLSLCALLEVCLVVFSVGKHVTFLPFIHKKSSGSSRDFSSLTCILPFLQARISNFGEAFICPIIIIRICFMLKYAKGVEMGRLPKASFIACSGFNVRTICSVILEKHFNAYNAWWQLSRIPFQKL